jgi:hypothetical protein
MPTKILLGMLIFWDDKNISTNSVQELSVFYTNVLNDVVLMLNFAGKVNTNVNISVVV